MKYRKFCKLDWEISEISIGVLRQEDAANDPGGEIGSENIDAIKYAVDNGVNYINLGYPLYFDNPEKASAKIRKVLDGGYRDKVRVAVNITARGNLSHQVLSKALDEQLKLFALDKADFCVIDGVNRDTWDTLKTAGVAEWVFKNVESGKADNVGVSFHDDAHYLKEICDTYSRWSPIQLELSMLDYKHHPGVGGFKFAKEYEAAVVVTDITKAGRLLKNVPEEIQRIYESTHGNMSPEERCLRWVLGFEEVSSAQLSAQAELNSVKQTEKYISCLTELSPGSVDVWEMLDAAKVRETYYKGRMYQCTSCRCCMPCPVVVDVPRIIELINDETMFSDPMIPSFQYNLENHQNTKCTGCGICEKHCPKRLPLQTIVKDALAKYGRG